MSIQSLKDLFKIKIKGKPAFDYPELPKGTTMFWDSTKYGTYIKDSIRRTLLNPRYNLDLATPRIK